MPSTFKSGSHLTLVFILEQRPEIDVTLLQTKDPVGGKVDLPVPPPTTVRTGPYTAVQESRDRIGI